MERDDRDRGTDTEKTLAEGERQERDSKIDRLRGRNRGRPIEERETESGERE